MSKKMEPWTKEDYDKFKALVCSETICTECSECDKSVVAILQCFDDLTANPYGE
jgi:hypothetical protein